VRERERERKKERDREIIVSTLNLNQDISLFLIPQKLNTTIMKIEIERLKCFEVRQLNYWDCCDIVHMQ
jgi:hypothetical protein